MLQPAKTMTSCKEYAASQLAICARPTNFLDAAAGNAQCIASQPRSCLLCVHIVMAQMNVNRLAISSLCRHKPTMTIKHTLWLGLHTPSPQTKLRHVKPLAHFSA